MRVLAMAVQGLNEIHVWASREGEGRGGRLRQWKRKRRTEEENLHSMLEMLHVSHGHGETNETVSMQRRVLQSWQTNLFGSGCAAKTLLIKQQEERTRREAALFADEFLAMIDTDGDGQISSCELAWSIKQNDFGKTRFEEAAKWLKQTPGKFMQYDARCDGNISRDNLRLAMLEFFKYSWKYRVAY